MRQYLGDSIQPSAQEKLDKLTKPEAWNVSPETAQKNFEFMRDLYKQESQTLVRAATDPTLYQSIGVKNNPTKNSTFTDKNKGNPVIVKEFKTFAIVKQGNEYFKVPIEEVDSYIMKKSKPAFGGQYGE